MSDTKPAPEGAPTTAAPASGATTPAPAAGATTPVPEAGAAAAQEAFGKYKARLAGGPMAMPAMAGWEMPGWGMPPSMGALPGYPPGYPYAASGPERPHPMGSLAERLGATVRLGVDLFNAALARGVSELGGGMASQWGGPWGGHGCGCGCERGDRCGYDCCEVMGNECCRPGVHGCGCGCC